MRRFVAALGLLSLLAVPAASAQAPHSARVVTIGNDTYAAGDAVNVDMQKPGSSDVLAAGGTVQIGAVAADLIVAGGTVLVRGPVGDDVRAAGGKVFIQGAVKGDLLVTGGEVTVESGSTIGGEVAVFGGKLVFGGAAKGKLRVTGGDIDLNGSVDGPVTVSGENVRIDGILRGDASVSAGTLAIGSGARFGGAVRYWSRAGAAEFGSSVQKGSATYDASLARSEHPQNTEKAFAAVMGIFGVFSLLSSALLILILALLMESGFTAAAQRIRYAPWKHLAAGLLYFILVPVLAAFLFVTLIGIPLALFVTFFYVFTIVFSSVLAALVLAKWLEQHLRQKWNVFLYMLVALLIVIGLKALLLIPILGWIVRLFLVAVSFGGILLGMWRPAPVAIEK
jgi:cytoskeletal protein CcmA (bactofilin family)